MSDVTAVTVSWINVSFTTPRIFNLEKDFRIATSSDSENTADVVISSKKWLKRPEAPYGQDFYAAVELKKQPNGNFTVSLDPTSKNYIFDYRDQGQKEMNDGRQCKLPIIELQDGDVFDFGIDSPFWSSEGDCGLGKFQIRYELEKEEKTEKVKICSKKPKLEELPDEILLKIFKHVPVEDIIANIPAVCQKFFDVAKFGVKIRNLNLYFATNKTFEEQPFYFPCESGVIAKLLNVHGVREYSISISDFVDNTFIKNIRSAIGPNTRKLSFEYYNVSEDEERDGSLLSNNCFETLLKKIEYSLKLKTLVYDWFGTSNGLHSGENWPVVPSIRNLALSFNSDRERLKAEHVFAKFINIETLRICDDKNTNNPGFWSVLGNEVAGNHLKRLSIENFPQANVPWIQFRELESLELITRSHVPCTEFVRACERCFDSLPNIKDLIVQFPHVRDGNGVAQFIAHLPRLIETVILDFNTVQVASVTNAVMSIASRCPYVRTLALKNIGTVGQFEMIYLFETCSRLNRVIVYENSNPRHNLCVSWPDPPIRGMLRYDRDSNVVRKIKFRLFPF